MIILIIIIIIIPIILIILIANLIPNYFVIVAIPVKFNPTPTTTNTIKQFGHIFCWGWRSGDEYGICNRHGKWSEWWIYTCVGRVGRA